jgi:hypothetical protein
VAIRVLSFGVPKVRIKATDARAALRASFLLYGRIVKGYDAPLVALFHRQYGVHSVRLLGLAARAKFQIPFDVRERYVRD